MTGLLLGIEIGGTKLQLGLGTGDGRLVSIERRVIRPEAGATGILDQIARAIGPLLEGRANPEAVGIGFGGPVDVDRGFVVRSHQVEGWDGFDLATWARLTLGIDRVAIANDADTAGLGEARFGVGAGMSPVFYVTVGSGIGGGLIVDGRIYRGAGAGAAEFGHLWVDDSGTPRLLEEIASGWSIGARARSLVNSTDHPIARAREGEIDARSVAIAAKRGDPLALAILARAAEAVGRALGHVVTLVSPRRIILGGGVSMIGRELWLDPICRTLEQRAFPPLRGSFDVVTAGLDEEVVIHGAIALAKESVGGLSA